MVDIEFIVMTANIALFGVICFFIGWRLAVEKMKREILSQAAKLMFNVELGRFIKYSIPLKFDFTTHLQTVANMKKRKRK